MPTSTDWDDRRSAFFDRWGIDTSRDETWGGYRDDDPGSFEGRHSFYEDDSDIFLPSIYTPEGSEEGEYLGRATKPLEWYRGRGEVERAIKDIGIKNWNSENDIGQVLAKLYKDEMEGVQRDDPEPEELEEPEGPTDARIAWDHFEGRRGEGSIPYTPGNPDSSRMSGMHAAANYADRATEDYNSRFIPHLMATANLTTEGQRQTNMEAIENMDFKVPNLSDLDPKELVDHYMDKLEIG